MVKLGKCNICGADTYTGGNGKETHGKYFGGMTTLDNLIEETFTKLDDTNWDTGKAKEVLRNFASQVVMSCLPEKHCEEEIGFNDCRQQFLDKAKEM
jgi:hypothetical protein